MTEAEILWSRLQNKLYRDEFAAAYLKKSIPFQIREIMKQRGLTQMALAEKTSLDQGVISRTINPDNGNLTLKTILRLASGFDVAFVGEFIPFSKLSRLCLNVPPDIGCVATFEEENEPKRDRP